MPSASLQSRIQAFEALSSTAPAASNLLESPISPTASSFHPIAPLVAPTFSNGSSSSSPSTPSLASQTSFIDLKDWIVEDGPVEPPSAFRHTPTRKLNGIRESSRTPSPSRKPASAKAMSNSSTPLINLESPPKPLTRPPLPPRRPSDHISTRRSVSTGSENGATSRTLGRPDSLAIEHTYPPSAHKFGAGRVGHASASSISSFHSVSLSSDGSNVEIHSPKLSSKQPSFTFEAESTVMDIDTASIAESFEHVSATSAPSPSTAIQFDWGRGIKSNTSPNREPPTLPIRPAVKIAPVIPPKPLARSVSGSSASTSTTTKTRRPPPPPPPPYQPRSRPSSSRTSVVSTSASTSDRSSVTSNITSTSRTSISTRNSAQVGGSVKSSPLLRPTPVPSAARSRYDYLFDRAVRGRQKAERRKKKAKLLSPPPPSPKKDLQAAGWRALSLDTITDTEDHPVLSSESDSDEEKGTSPISPEEKLNGRIVKYIWSASRLDREKLRSIWSDCDPQSTGFIDRDAFVKGMWRIDEELRKVQLAQRTSALTAASSQRIPHRPVPPPRSKDTAHLLI